MNKHKLDKNEMQTISHFIAQRRVAGDHGIGMLETNTATDIYLETYNEIMNKIYIPHLKWGPRQSRGVA